MPKKETISSYIPRFALVFCLIVSFSVLVGSMNYLMKSRIRTEPVKERNLMILTDKTEYMQGEEIKISIKNNKEGEAFLSFPSVEVFEPADGNVGDGQWTAIRTVWSGCGVTGGMLFLPISAGGSYEYSWDQKEKWCTGEAWEMSMDSQEVRGGKYRVTAVIAKRTESAEEDPNNISGQLTDDFVYSNEFVIKEASLIEMGCRKKVRGVGSCKMVSTGYEFDSTIGKCIQKNASGCTFEIPFNQLEECQSICELQSGF